MFGLPPTDHSTVSQMSESAAHTILQDHLDCPITVCPVKLQAKTYLVRIGKLVPRTGPATWMGF